MSIPSDRTSAFFAEHDATEAEAKSSPAGALLIPLGFTVFHSGGGCYVWAKPPSEPADPHDQIWISATSGLGDPLTSDPSSPVWTIGRYNDENFFELSRQQLPDAIAAQPIFDRLDSSRLPNKTIYSLQDPQEHAASITTEFTRGS